MHAYLLGGRPIFLPFLSGALRYDCAKCDAPCCKGAYLAIGRSAELVTIQEAQPRSTLFSVPTFHRSTMLSIATPAERCWFLDKQNGCRLERVLGREAKPAGCRLFPFVRFRSLGEGLAVLPDFVCPLTVGTPTSGGPTSHDAIVQEMHRSHVPRTGHPELPRPRDLTWGEALPLERRIVEESERFLGSKTYLDYAELQHELALATLGVDGKPGAMRHVETAVRRFTGVVERPTDGGVYDLVVLTGVARLQMSALPRREIAGVLVALSVLLGAYEHMRGARRTARTIPSMLEHDLPFLYVLANLGARPTVRPGVSLARAVSELPSVRAPLLSVLEDIERNGKKNVADTLEDILHKRSEPFERPLSADAVGMLHSLGNVLLRACSFVPV